jgi:hypothetical protein
VLGSLSVVFDIAWNTLFVVGRPAATRYVDATASS